MRKSAVQVVIFLAASSVVLLGFAFGQPRNPQQPKSAKMAAAPTAAIPTVQAAGSMQMKMSGGALIEGASAVPDHIGWVEFQEIIFVGGRPQASTETTPGASRTVGKITPSQKTATAGSAGLASHSEFTVTKRLDVSSPKLLQLARSGRPLQEVVIDLYDPHSPGRIIRRVRLEQVLVVSVQSGGLAAGGKIQLEKVTLKGRKTSDQQF